MVFTVGPKIAKVRGPLSTNRLVYALALPHPKPCGCQFSLLGRLEVIVSWPDRVYWARNQTELEIGGGGSKACLHPFPGTTPSIGVESDVTPWDDLSVEVPLDTGSREQGLHSGIWLMN